MVFGSKAAGRISVPRSDSRPPMKRYRKAGGSRTFFRRKLLIVLILVQVLIVISQVNLTVDPL